MFGAIGFASARPWPRRRADLARDFVRLGMLEQAGRKAAGEDDGAVGPLLLGFQKGPKAVRHCGRVRRLAADRCEGFRPFHPLNALRVALAADGPKEANATAQLFHLDPGGVRQELAGARETHAAASATPELEPGSEKTTPAARPAPGVQNARRP